jgi:hypothetical protein
VLTLPLLAPMTITQETAASCLAGPKVGTRLREDLIRRRMFSLGVNFQKLVAAVAEPALRKMNGHRRFDP